MPRTKGPITRDYTLTVLLSDEERDLLRDLAARAGLDVSSYLRTWIRDEAAALGLTTAKRRAKR